MTKVDLLNESSPLKTVRSWLLGLPGRIQRKEVLYVDTFTTVSVRHTGAVALVLL